MRRSRDLRTTALGVSNTAGFLLVLVAIVVAIEASKYFTKGSAAQASGSAAQGATSLPAGVSPAQAAQWVGGSGAPSSSGGPADVAAWVQQHLAAFPGLSQQEATNWLTAQGFSETGFTDVTNSVGATGPYQFYGSTYQNAVASGFNVHTVTGSLDAFLASGDLALGVQAYRSALNAGAQEVDAAKAAYLAVGRPGTTPGELANLARWPQYYAQALQAQGVAATP